jgi:hypothetical protein
MTNNKSIEGSDRLLSDIEIISFGVWLTQNCKPSPSKDGWWIYKPGKIWLTTDECLMRFRETKFNTDSFLGDNKDGK